MILTWGLADLAEDAIATISRRTLAPVFEQTTAANTVRRRDSISNANESKPTPTRVSVGLLLCDLL